MRFSSDTKLEPNFVACFYWCLCNIPNQAKYPRNSKEVLELKLQLVSNPVSSESVTENPLTSKGEDFIHELYGSEPFLIKETKPTRRLMQHSPKTCLDAMKHIKIFLTLA